MKKLVHFSDATAFLKQVHSFLLALDTENNLFLGVAEAARKSSEKGNEPIYFAAISVDDRIIGAAMRQPKRPLLLTRMDSDALQILAEDIAPFISEGLSILGPRPEVDRFAEICESFCETPSALVVAQGVYHAEAVRDIALPDVTTRPAHSGDTALLIEWCNQFDKETLPPEHWTDNTDLVIEKITDGSLFVCEDGEVVSMAATAGVNAAGIRIRQVYTPEALRGKGYATACVHALTSKLLGEGYRKCFLYTDLSNPISNKLYQHIGFQQVCESALFRVGKVS